MADQSKNKWFPWRRLLRSTQTPRPETREVAVSQVTDKYSEYPSDGLTPVRLAEIFKEADAGDVLRQAELFEEMEEKDPHLFSQLQTRKNAVTGLDYEVIPFDSDDPRDKEIAEFVEAQIGGIEGFEDVMLDLLDAIGKGFAVSEIMWSYDEGHVVVGDIRSRHQKRFFWDTVDDSFKVRTQDAPEGILLPKNKFIVHKYKARSGHPSRAGVLRVVSWMYLFKNYTLKDWVAFCEVFGMPLTSEGYEGLDPLQADLIFRTNIQTAYNVGHYEQMTDPGVMKLRPYWQYDAVNDAHTRPSHLAMDGRVFPADSAVWDSWFPPNGFRCRCTVKTLSKRQVEARGLKVEQSAPGGVMPDPHFSTNPAKVRFTPDLKDYPEALVKAYKKREKENPSL